MTDSEHKAFSILRRALEKIENTPNPEHHSGAHLTELGRGQLAFATIDNIKHIARTALAEASA